MRSQPRTPWSRLRSGLISGLVAGALAAGGLAAVPVASSEGDADGHRGPPAEVRASSAPSTAPTATSADAPESTPAEGAGGEPGPDPDGDPDDPAEPEVWDRLADCEAGDWDRDGQPIEGTARWDYGLEFAHDGYEQFQGGLNFHPDTWDGFRDPDMPDHAGHATRAQEIEVGERVLSAQGWGAWPVCSRMLGLR